MGPQNVWLGHKGGKNLKVENRELKYLKGNRSKTKEAKRAGRNLMRNKKGAVGGPIHQNTV